MYQKPQIIKSYSVENFSCGNLAGSVDAWTNWIPGEGGGGGWSRSWART